MAIITLDGLLAGLKPATAFTKAAFTGEAAGQFHSLFAVAGRPAAGAFATPGLNGATVDVASGIGGMLPFDNPASGNAYLARLSVALGAGVVGLTLYDLLWYNTGIGITTTTAQSITSPTWPARDRNGATLGDGLEAWLYVSATAGNSGTIANTSISYTNQAGTSGRSSGTAYIVPITPVAGTVIPFGLQGSDTGIRSIQSITLGTSYISGTVHLLVVRRLASVFGAAGGGVTADAFAVGMPQVFPSSAVYLAAHVSATAAGAVSGDLNFSHG